MSNELDSLDPRPETLTLTNGLEVQFEDLKARQFFKLLRILTHGALPMLGDSTFFSISGDDTADELSGKLLAMVIMAVPNAEDQSLEFVRAMVKPVGLIDKRDVRNKQDRARNEELWASLDEELDNPELEDLFGIIEGIIKRESEDLAALGKRIMSMLNLADKTGQLPPQINLQKTSTTNSSEPSREVSTSSVPTTEATRTETVQTSLFESSDPTSQQSNSESGTTPQPVLS